MYHVAIYFREDVPREEEERLRVYRIVQNLEQYYSTIINSKPYSKISDFVILAGKVEEKA